MNDISKKDKRKYISLIISFCLLISLACTSYELYLNRQNHFLLLASSSMLALLPLSCVAHLISINTIVNTLISCSLLFISTDAYLNEGLDSRLLLWLLIVAFFSSANSKLKYCYFWLTYISLFILGSFYFDFIVLDSDLNFSYLLPCMSFNIYAIVYANNKDRREKTISKLMKEKKESLAQKELYLRILSHDISTPLTILKTVHANSNLNFIKHPEMARKSVSKIEKILKNCRSLETIDLLKVHDTDKVLLNPIIMESLAQFTTEIENKKLNIIIDIDKTEMTKIIGSKTTLETSLFNNLIHNAIKFSEENADIVIRSYRSTQSAYLMIMNQASKQASDSLKSARKFKLSSTLGTSGEIGNGFGLFIADKICHKYGGYLAFDTKKEAENSFLITARVSLPI